MPVQISEAGLFGSSPTLTFYFTADLRFDCIKVFAFGHNEQALAGAAGFPEAADVALLFGIRVAPKMLALKFHNKKTAIVQEADEIRVELVA